MQLLSVLVSWNLHLTENVVAVVNFRRLESCSDLKLSCCVNTLSVTKLSRKIINDNCVVIQ